MLPLTTNIQLQLQFDVSNKTFESAEASRSNAYSGTAVYRLPIRPASNEFTHVPINTLNPRSNR